MRLIDRISGAPNQKMTIITEEGDAVTAEFKYLASQQRWMMNIAYDDFVSNGMAMVCSPNFLRGFKNVLPFGVAILSTDALDPLFLNDFESGRIRLFVLNSADVKSVEAAYFQ